MALVSAQKKTVVFSSYDDITNPYYGGGGARAIHEIARRLKNHEAQVFSGAYGGQSNSVIDGVRYHRVGSNTFGPKLGQIWFQLALPFQTRRTEFDLWVESLTPPFSTACLQVFTSRPVCLVTQNLIGRAMAQKYRLPLHFIEHIGLKTYRFGVALSEPIRAQLLQSNPRMQVEVIPNGVDSQLIERRVVNRGQNILFLGRIDVRQKGLDLLLEAFSSIRNETTANLVIAGAGLKRDEESVRNMVATLGLQDRVKMIGNVSGPAKDEAFERALCLCMPSRFEGLPLTLMEASCWEVPVVMFAIPELAWVPDEVGVKVQPFDASAFGRAVLKMVRGQEARRAMGTAAKAWVRNFSWDALAVRYDQFFQRILGAASHLPNTA